MSTKLGTGKGNDIHAAMVAAWAEAKEHEIVKAKNGERETYPCEISIEASNPIHSYIVTILQP